MHESCYRKIEADVPACHYLKKADFTLTFAPGSPGSPYKAEMRAAALLACVLRQNFCV